MRGSVSRVLVIGSGPIVIGQAAEFDGDRGRGHGQFRGGSGIQQWLTVSLGRDHFRKRQPGRRRRALQHAGRADRADFSRRCFLRVSPAAIRICSLTRSIPVTFSVTGCSTWIRVFISMKK